VEGVEEEVGRVVGEGFGGGEGLPVHARDGMKNFE
jgi:hypothetical protein